MSDIDALVADLGRVPARVLPNVDRAMEVAARGLKDDWAVEAAAANPTHAVRYPRTISYDLRPRFDGPSAVIGPELGGQGSLGLLEDSPGGVASAPQRNWQRPLQAAGESLERGIARATGGILG